MISYATAYYIEDRKDDTKINCIKKLKVVNTENGFKIDVLLTNIKFDSVRYRLVILGINLNTTSVSKHVGDIERFIRVLKEHIRVVVSTLPFSHYPKTMELGLGRLCSFWLNVLPSKNG